MKFKADNLTFRNFIIVYITKCERRRSVMECCQNESCCKPSICGIDLCTILWAIVIIAVISCVCGNKNHGCCWELLKTAAGSFTYAPAAHFFMLEYNKNNIIIAYSVWMFRNFDIRHACGGPLWKNSFCKVKNVWKSYPTFSLYKCFMINKNLTTAVKYDMI